MVLIGAGVLALVMTLIPQLHVNLLAAVLLIILFGFFFSVVSSRITGELGSSSCPISGMAIATLMGTCLLFVLLGWTSHAHEAVALAIGGIVCIAASNAGTTSQDLKTGYPRGRHALAAAGGPHRRGPGLRLRRGLDRAVPEPQLQPRSSRPATT